MQNQNTEKASKETGLTDSRKGSGRSRRIAMLSIHGYVVAEPPLGAPDTGGQVVYVLELSKVLGRMGFKVDIFTRRFENQSEVEKVDENVRIVRMGCGGKDFIPKEYMINYLDEWVANAMAWIKAGKLRYKYLISHYWDAGWAGHVLSGLLSIPHIHTPHSLGAWKKKNMEKDYANGSTAFEKTYNFAVRIDTEKKLYHACDSLIATTPIQRNLMIEEYGLEAAKIAMIPPGYDDNRFYPMAEASKAMLKEHHGLTGKSIFVLSRLAHNKGLDLLVEAFNILVSRYCDADLYLAVGHDERSDSEEQVYRLVMTAIEKYQLYDKVHFLGFIADEDLPGFYQAADMFVLCSRYEPFGMTAVESMACGTPTIVTTHGGLCQVLEDGIHALLSDPFKPEELAMDMASIFRHSGIAQHLSYMGSQMARDNFSWTEIGNKLLATVNRKRIHE